MNPASTSLHRCPRRSASLIIRPTEPSSSCGGGKVSSPLRHVVSDYDFRTLASLRHGQAQQQQQHDQSSSAGTAELFQDDYLWKELQDEIRTNGAVTNVAVHEIAQKFLQDRSSSPSQDQDDGTSSLLREAGSEYNNFFAATLAPVASGMKRVSSRGSMALIEAFNPMKESVAVSVAVGHGVPLHHHHPPPVPENKPFEGGQGFQHRTSAYSAQNLHDIHAFVPKKGDASSTLAVPKMSSGGILSGQKNWLKAISNNLGNEASAKTTDISSAVKLPSSHGLLSSHRGSIVDDNRGIFHTLHTAAKFADCDTPATAALAAARLEEEKKDEEGGQEEVGMELMEKTTNELLQRRRQSPSRNRSVAAQTA